MNSDSLLQSRVTSIFGIFMIFLYATLGLLLLLGVIWVDLPRRTAIGIILLLWAAFRTFMLFRMRARMKHIEPDENH